VPQFLRKLKAGKKAPARTFDRVSRGFRGGGSGMMVPYRGIVS